MRKPVLLLAVLLTVFPLQTFAAVELVLKDGRRVRGESVERRGDLYFLQLEGDGAATFPRLLVTSIRFSEETEPVEEEPENAGPEAEIVPAVDPGVEPEQTPEGDSEETEEAERDRYDATRLPAQSEQLAVFGEPSRFPSPPVKTSWKPTDSLGRMTDVTDFNPATWYRSSYDPVWRPTSGFARETGPPDFNPARWYRPRFRSTWRPVNGWGPSEWFPSVVSTGD